MHKADNNCFYFIRIPVPAMKKKFIAMSIACLISGGASYAKPPQKDKINTPQTSPDASIDIPPPAPVFEQNPAHTLEWYTQHKQQRSETIQACASNSSIQVSTSDCTNAINSAVANP